MRARAMTRLATLTVVAWAVSSALHAEPVYKISVIDNGGPNPVLFPDHLSALAAAPEAEPTMLSADLVLAKCRIVEDGVYAALEEQLQRGAEKMPLGKSGLLKRLAEELLTLESPKTAQTVETASRAIAYVAAARTASGEADVGLLAEEPQRLCDALVAAYASDVFRSTPLGYYGWTEALRNAYAQDRLLQTPLVVTPGAEITDRAARELGDSVEEQFAVAELISDCILNDAEMLQSYSVLMSLYQGLYGPPEALCALDFQGIDDLPSLQQSPAYRLIAGGSPGGRVEWQLFPHPFGREARFFDVLYAAGEPADPTALRKYLADVDAGTAPVSAPADQGFYALSEYSLYALLLPDRSMEAAVLAHTPEYAQRLRSQYGVSPGQTKETRAKRVGSAVRGVGTFSVEPLPTLYVRRAAAIGALRKCIVGALGESSPSYIKGLRDDGSRAAAPVAKELQDLQHLLLGLYAASCTDLSLDLLSAEIADPEQEGAHLYSESQLATWAEEANAWSLRRASDPDLARDVRRVTPVRQRLDRATHYWSCLGVQLARIEVSALLPDAGEPVKTWTTVEVCAEGIRKGEGATTETLRAALDETARPKVGRRLVGASTGFPWLRLLGWGACGLALLALLGGAVAFVVSRGRPQPRYAARRRTGKARPRKPTRRGGGPRSS